jgi:hypothetical protein
LEIREMSQPTLLPQIDDPGPDIGGRWKVIIYNNDYTDRDQVCEILMRATLCELQEAEIEVWEAEAYGKAPVHFAGREECESAAWIISKIGVKTEVSPEWDA